MTAIENHPECNVILYINYFMEKETIYDDDDRRDIGTLKTEGLEGGLSEHCLAINSAVSLTELRKFCFVDAYVWLNQIMFSSENFGHDFVRIQRIFGRVFGRRMVALLGKPKTEGTDGKKDGVIA